MNKNKAAPRPWRQCKADNDGCSCGLIWSVPGDAVVATAPAVDDRAGIDLTPAMARANAALIVRAVNEREELVGTLKMMTATLISLAPYAPEVAEGVVAIVGVAKDLIAKATGDEE